MPACPSPPGTRPPSRGRSPWCGRSPAAGSTGPRAPCSCPIRRRCGPSTRCSSPSSAIAAPGRGLRSRGGADRRVAAGRPAEGRRTPPRRGTRPSRRRATRVAVASAGGDDDEDAAEVEVPLAMASDEELLGRRSFDALEPARAGPALPADVAPRARDAAAAHAPLRAGAPGRAGRPAADPARQPPHGGDPMRLAHRRRRVARRRLVMLCDISGSMEPYARAYLQFLDLRRAHRPERRGVRVRHPPDAPDPGARAPATRSARSSAPPPPRPTGRAAPASATR